MPPPGPSTPELKRKREPPPGVSITAATPADAPVLAGLLRTLLFAHKAEFPVVKKLSFDALYKAVLSSDAPANLAAQWQLWLRDRKWRTFLLSLKNGTVVGMIHYCPQHSEYTPDYPHPHVHIAHMVVEPRERRKGYAGMLLSHIYNLHPHAEFRLAVATDAARSLYSEYGFAHQIADWKKEGIQWFGMSTHRPQCFSRFAGRWQTAWRVEKEKVARWKIKEMASGYTWLFTPTSIRLTSEPGSHIDEIVWSAPPQVGKVRFRLRLSPDRYPDESDQRLTYRIELTPRSVGQKGEWSLYGTQRSAGQKTMKTENVVMRAWAPDK